MMKKFLFSILFSLCFQTLFSQEDISGQDRWKDVLNIIVHGNNQPSADTYEEIDYKNNLKINLTTFANKAFEAQYERNLIGNISAAIGVRILPKGKPALLKSISTDIIPKEFLTDIDLGAYADIRLDIGKFEYGAMVITPEIRYYFPGPMKGIYLGFYGIYKKSSSYFPVSYYSTNHILHEYKLNGDITTIGGGMKLGLQFNVKRFCFEMLLAGGHKSSKSGSYTVDMSVPLLNDDINFLKQKVDEINKSFLFEIFEEFKYDIQPTKITITPFKDSFGFVFGSVMLGYRF